MSLSTRLDMDMRRVLGIPDYVGESFAVFPSYTNDGPDTPRYLITIDKGIGDAIAIGLSAVEQIIENDAGAYGAIDIFHCDPRINRIIQTPLTFYPSPQPTSWLKLFRRRESSSGHGCFLKDALHSAEIGRLSIVHRDRRVRFQASPAHNRPVTTLQVRYGKGIPVILECCMHM